jgi:hypothetical protein
MNGFKHATEMERGSPKSFVPVESQSTRERDNIDVVSRR